jgi:hypothetical protein
VQWSPGMRSNLLDQKGKHEDITRCQTNWLAPRSRVLLSQTVVRRVVKKFPPRYGTEWIINVFTTARDLSLSRARLFQSTFFKIILIFSYLLPGLPSHLLIPDFPVQWYIYIYIYIYIYMSSPSFVLHAPPNNICSEVHNMNCLMHNPLASSVLGVNQFLSIEYSNTLSLYVLPLVRESKVQTHKKQDAKLYFRTFIIIA